MAINQHHLPLRDIPNFSAALGKSPRSTVPNDRFLFEYLLQRERERQIHHTRTKPKAA